MKTDSWLIRTLNNASIVGKQKQREDEVDRRSLEFSNSSEIVDIKPDQLAPSSTANITSTGDIKTRATIIDSEYPVIFSREHVFNSFVKNGETSMKELDSHIGRATYSETVRRSMKPSNLERKESLKSCATNSSVATVIPIPSRKCQRKDPEQSYQLLHKSRKSADKKIVRNADSSNLQLEEGSCMKVGDVKLNNVTSKSSTAKTNHGKKKDLEWKDLEGKCFSKSGDRGWSVWCSSKKKQNLSSLAFNKLETIHQAIWQMDEAKIFKYPLSCDNKDGQSSSALVSLNKERKRREKVEIFIEKKYIFFFHFSDGRLLQGY